MPTRSWCPCCPRTSTPTPAAGEPASAGEPGAPAEPEAPAGPLGPGDRSQALSGEAAATAAAPASDGLERLPEVYFLGLAGLPPEPSFAAQESRIWSAQFL